MHLSEFFWGGDCLLVGVAKFMPALKAACAAIGSGLPAVPFTPVIEEQRQAITAILERHGLLGAPNRST